MTVDQTILIWCLVVPASIAGVAALIAWRLRSRWQAIALSAGWWLAIATSIIGVHGWRWWPEEGWQQSIWTLLAWAVLLPLTEAGSGSRWVLAGILGSLTAMVAIPSGDTWSDTFHLHRVWMAAIAVSCLVNAYSIECLSNRGGRRWSLWIALTALISPMVLAASCYGSLAQWSLAVVVATLVVVVFVAISPSTDVWTAGFGAVAAAALVTTTGRFHTYSDHPTWMYGMLLFGCTLASLADYPIRRRSASIRIATSTLVMAAMIGICVWQVLIR